MRYRKLGRTGLTVSEICLGTMTFGGDGFWKVIGALPQQEVNALVKSAFDKGVNFLDTADVYSNGLSEQVTGQAIKDLPRDELVVATKVFGRMGAYNNDQSPEAQRRFNNTNLWGLSRKHIFDGIDASLKRLNLDYVDLYQVHAFDPLTPLEETLEALDEVVASGKVRYIGLCNFAAWQIAKALGISARKEIARFESLQMYYSIAGRDLEREIVPMLTDQKVGLMVWSPLAGGLLSGKFGPGSNGPEGARRAAFDFPPVNKDRAWACIDLMREIGHAHGGASVARVALAYVLAKPFVTTVIIGAKTMEQLDDNLEAAKLTLTSDERKKLDDVSALPPEYPGWMLARQGAERRPQPK